MAIALMVAGEIVFWAGLIVMIILLVVLQRKKNRIRRGENRRGERR